MFGTANRRNPGGAWSRPPDPRRGRVIRRRCRAVGWKRRRDRRPSGRAGPRGRSNVLTSPSSSIGWRSSSPAQAAISRALRSRVRRGAPPHRGRFNTNRWCPVPVLHAGDGSMVYAIGASAEGRGVPTRCPGTGPGLRETYGRGDAALRRRQELLPLSPPDEERRTRAHRATRGSSSEMCSPGSRPARDLRFTGGCSATSRGTGSGRALEVRRGTALRQLVGRENGSQLFRRRRAASPRPYVSRIPVTRTRDSRGTPRTWPMAPMA